jgi:hypothetical protein
VAHRVGRGHALTGAITGAQRSKWKGRVTCLVVETSSRLLISGGTGESFAPSDVSGTACGRRCFVATVFRAMVAPIVRLFSEL